MMKIKIIKKLSLAAVLLSSMNAVYATGQGGYFGLMVGQSNLNGQNQTEAVPGGTLTLKPNGSGIGTRLFAGYNLNQYAAFEGGFTYYSSMNYKLTEQTATQTTDVSNTLKTRAASFELLGKGMIPFADTGFGAFAKLGGAYFVTKTTGKVENFSIKSQSSSVFRPVVAIGVSYDMTQNWVADLSYTSIRYSNSQIKNPSFIALGISYHLLDPVCGQFLC